MKEPKLKDLTNEDLRWEWDKAIENNNQRRAAAVEREIRKRKEADSYEL